MIYHIKKSDFEKEVLSSDIPVVMDFYASWCAPCLAQGRIIENLSSLWDEKVKFCKIDVDEDPDFASDYDIETIPTLVFYKNGRKIGQYSGVLDKEGMKRMLEI